MSEEGVLLQGYNPVMADVSILRRSNPQSLYINDAQSQHSLRVCLQDPRDLKKERLDTKSDTATLLPFPTRRMACFACR